jgi:hypothetical protein
MARSGWSFVTGEEKRGRKGILTVSQMYTRHIIMRSKNLTLIDTGN